MSDESFFDSMAERWDSLQTARDFEAIRQILRRAAAGPEDTVLDVGAGTGVLVPFLADVGIDPEAVTAIEPSLAMARVLRRKHPRVRVLTQDFCLPFEDEGLFSLVIVFNAFPHFPDPLAALRNAARAVKPGGRVVIAHSLTREELNALHASTHDEVANDMLPSDQEFLSFFLKVQLVPSAISNAPWFYAEARRPLRDQGPPRPHPGADAPEKQGTTAASKKISP